jgi:hypothetical protein
MLFYHPAVLPLLVLVISPTFILTLQPTIAAETLPTSTNETTSTIQMVAVDSSHVIAGR